MAACSMRKRAMNIRTTASHPTSVTDGPPGNGGWACDSRTSNLPSHIGTGFVTGLPGTGLPVARRLHGQGSCAFRWGPGATQAPWSSFGGKESMTHRSLRFSTVPDSCRGTESSGNQQPLYRLPLPTLMDLDCRCSNVVRQTVLAAWHAQSDDSGPARCNQPPV